MSNSFDLSTVTLETLKENGYDEKLIEALKSENFLYLENSDVKSRLQDREFVEPLMYACINSRKLEMFEIYAHLEDRVQSQLLTDYNLSCNILLNAPKVIENTPLAEDERAILANVNNRPEIVRYISNDLMDNPTFVTELSTKNQEVVKEMVDKYPVDKLIIANPSLLNNPTFVVEAVSQNRAAVVEYALANKDKLEMLEINTIKDAVKGEAEKDYMKVIEENAEKGVDKRFNTVREKLAERGKDNPYKVKWITAMAAQAETVEPEMVSKLLDYLTMARLKLEKVMQAEPEHEISKEEMAELVTPLILNRLISKAQIKEMAPEMEQKVEEYMKFYEEFHGKFQQQKQAKLEQEKQQTVEQSKENAERQIGVAIISGNNTQGLDSFEDLGSVGREKIELTPEQLRQQEADLAARNVPRENVQVVEKTQVSRNEGQDR